MDAILVINSTASLFSRLVVVGGLQSRKAVGISDEVELFYQRSLPEGGGPRLPVDVAVAYVEHSAQWA